MGGFTAGASGHVDQALVDIVDYVHDTRPLGARAHRIARYCLIDALGCAFEALRFPECTKLLGPIVPGVSTENGARVPGTSFTLDPVTAAFNTGTLIRWLDFNDALAAAQGGHPSDNYGGILAAADWVSRVRTARGEPPLVMRDVLTAAIKAYEIQGLYSLENSFQKRAVDYVALTRVATAAVVAPLLGADRRQTLSALSHAWADGLSLTLYRQGADTGARKSWAAGDATARGVQLALLAVRGEMGYPRVLSAPTYGLYDAFFAGQPLRQPRAYASHVIEHIVSFKIVPAGMQGQSAAECAFRLHGHVKDRLDDIDTITVGSHERMMRIMDKQGPLTNPADRDHCAQYVIAVGLIHGRIGVGDFEDDFAADPRIDRLRARMQVVEVPEHTRAFFDPAKRSNTHSLEIAFRDGARTPKVVVEYPTGHPPLGDDAFRMVEDKFARHLARAFPKARQKAILDACLAPEAFERMPVPAFLELFTV